MRIHLKRFAYTPYATLGRLQVDEEHSFYTIERPWLNNRPFESCIPQGVYVCERYSSKRYPDTFEVAGVPDRSKILFHVANWADDVQGCIGLGMSLMDGSYGVASSRVACQKFMELMQDHTEFELLIGQYQPVYP